jgi:DNA-directed RNA polymerase subunit RPC12/RpoP
MLIKCSSCNSDFPIKDKGYHRQNKISSDRIHKMAVCPNCGTKNFYSILNKYTDK